MSHRTCVHFVLQIKLYEAMFFHRPGALHKTCWLRATEKYRNRKIHHTVKIDCGEASPWIGTLEFFLTCTFQGETRKLVVVRWYKNFGRPEDPGMTWVFLSFSGFFAVSACLHVTQRVYK